MDEDAVKQAVFHDHILVVEGCWDVAKLVEANIKNVVATFGAHLSDQQIDRFEFIAQHLGVNNLKFWYDRDDAGVVGQRDAMKTIRERSGLGIKRFYWDATFSSKTRGNISIPQTITDVCEFSVPQLQWLRNQEII